MFGGRNKNLISIMFFGMLAPTVLTNLVTAIGSFADAIIVGNLVSDVALSSVTFVSPIFMMINLIAALLAVGGATLYSIYIGKADTRNSNKIFSCAITYGTFVGLTISVLGFIFIKDIALLLGATGEVLPLVENYGIVILLGAPIFILNINLSFFVRNDGRAKLAMTGMLSSIAINIVFDIFFISVCNFGVMGAALALVFSQFVSALIIGSHFLSKKNNLKFKISFNVKNIINIIAQGAGTSLTFVYQVVTMLFLNHFIMNTAGAKGMIVYTIVFNVNLIAMSIFEGVSQTVQPMISVFHGEKNDKMISKTMSLSLKSGIVLSLIAIALVEIFPSNIAAIFGVTDSGLIESSAIAVRIVAPAIVLMTINVILSYYFQSREYKLIPFFIVISRNLIFLLINIIVLYLIFKTNGIWMAYIVSEVFTFSIILILTALKRRKNPELKSILLIKKDDKKELFDFCLNEVDVDNELKTLSQNSNYEKLIKLLKDIKANSKTKIYVMISVADEITVWVNGGELNLETDFELMSALGQNRFQIKE